MGPGQPRPGALFPVGGEWVLRVSQVGSLLVNLKQQGRDQSVEGKKRKSRQMGSFQIHCDVSRAEGLGEGAAWLSHAVWQGISWGWPSLKWRPQQSKRKSEKKQQGGGDAAWAPKRECVTRTIRQHQPPRTKGTKGSPCSVPCPTHQRLLQ